MRDERVIGMVAKEVKRLREGGVADDVIERMVDLLVERQMHPRSLPTLQLAAVQGPPRRRGEPRFVSPSTVCEHCGATLGEGHLEDCPTMPRLA